MVDWWEVLATFPMGNKMNGKLFLQALCVLGTLGGCIYLSSTNHGDAAFCLGIAGIIMLSTVTTGESELW